MHLLYTFSAFITANLSFHQCILSQCVSLYSIGPTRIHPPPIGQSDLVKQMFQDVILCFKPSRILSFGST